LGSKLKAHPSLKWVYDAIAIACGHQKFGTSKRHFGIILQKKFIKEKLGPETKIRHPFFCIKLNQCCTENELYISSRRDDVTIKVWH
jgi:hypothetical protein